MEEKYCVLVRHEETNSSANQGLTQALEDLLPQLSSSSIAEKMNGMMLIVFPNADALAKGLACLGALIFQNASKETGWEQVAVGVDHGHIFHLADRSGIKHFTGASLRIARRLAENCPLGRLWFTPGAYSALRATSSSLVSLLRPLTNESRRLDIALGLIEYETSWKELVIAQGGVDVLLSRLTPPVSVVDQDKIIKLLAERVGPVASHLVTEAMQTVKLPDFPDHLGQYIANPTQRKVFKQELTMMLRLSADNLPSRSDKLHALLKLLGNYVGPVAHVLMEQGAPRSGQGLIEFLCSRIPDPAKSEAFMHEAMRLLREDAVENTPR